MALDPQTMPFAPRGDDIWQFETDIARVQQTQAEHAERLARLEKRQDEDARLKSVWGPSSPFPGVLSGTPQQEPIAQPLTDAFSEFDDQSQLIGSLHLDPEDEPRRIGATSRANSVRFDETANQGHWAHPSRSSIELIPRTGSSLSTHPMIERTYSHKSDGRQSSAGQSVHSVHSVHSAASGRANSLGADTTYSATGASPLDMTTITPGLSFLGPVPAIIRCWLTTAFRHDSLLYAAVSSGSQHSMIDEDIIQQLGYSDQVRNNAPNRRSIRIPVYLPEATVRTASSRSSSPTPQLPALTVDFLVAPSAPVHQKTRMSPHLAEKSVRIFLGSDVLQKHRADILFSCKSITLFDDDQSKVTIPMVRPEDEEGFRHLTITNLRFRFAESEPDYKQTPPESLVLEGLQQLPRMPISTAPDASIARPSSWDSPGNKDRGGREEEVPTHSEGAGQQTVERIVSTSLISKASAKSDIASPTGQVRVSSSVWGNWRHENAVRSVEQGEMSRNMVSSGLRKEGIKVLRPVRSTSSDQSKQLQSRFFDDSEPRPGPSVQDKPGSMDELRETASLIKNTVATGPLRTPNPVGGASAFSWMKK